MHDDSKDLQAIEDFCSKEENKFQLISNTKGEPIALLIGSDATLDSIIAAIAITDKLLTGERRSGQQLQ